MGLDFFQAKEFCIFLKFLYMRFFVRVFLLCVFMRRARVFSKKQNKKHEAKKSAFKHSKKFIEKKENRENLENTTFLNHKIH